MARIPFIRSKILNGFEDGYTKLFSIHAELLEQCHQCALIVHGFPLLSPEAPSPAYRTVSVGFVQSRRQLGHKAKAVPEGSVAEAGIALTRLVYEVENGQIVHITPG